MTAMPFAGLRLRMQRRKEVPATWTRPAMPEVPNQWDMNPMECAVMSMVVEGKSCVEIGKALCVVNSTAGRYVARILEKMGVQNKMEAALMWVQRDSDSGLSDQAPRLVNPVSGA